MVEDDLPIRVMVTDLLSDAGYGVTEAQTGHEALSRLHERRPDLIVLDLMLPGMSGWEFLDRAREQLARAKIPVMIFSAIHGKSDYPATLGVAAWFTKPLDIPRFLGAVEQLAGVPHFAHTKRSPLSSTSARILIVEDESTIRDLVTEQLDGAGYMTDAVGSTTEAWQRIDAHRPDLILLDLMLPVEDGWTFLHRRRDDTLLASIPVVVISAAPHARLLEAKTIGADAFLSKPFDLEALTALVRSFVG